MSYKKQYTNGINLLQRIALILCFSVFTACGGAGKIQSSISGKQIKEMRYFSPIYTKQKPEFAKSKRHFHFITATTKILDSIFETDAEKYRIRGKISEPNAKEVQRIYAGIALVFREVEDNKNVRDIRIPMVIRSVLKKQHSRFALAMLIAPDFITYNQRFPDKILIGGGVLNSYFVKSGTIHVLIFDLKKNNIAFYRKLAGVRGLGHSKKFLAHALSQIFRSYLF